MVKSKGSATATATARAVSEIDEDIRYYGGTGDLDAISTQK